MRTEFHARRDLVVERIRKVPGFSLPNVPQGAFYAFPNISELIGATLGGKTITDGDSLADLLLSEAHVAVVGGNDFGAPEHVRLSYATSRENLNNAFDRLERTLAHVKSKLLLCKKRRRFLSRSPSAGAGLFRTSANVLKVSPGPRYVWQLFF